MIRVLPLMVLAGLLLLAALLVAVATGGRVSGSDPRRYRPRQRHRESATAFADDLGADDSAASGDATAPGTHARAAGVDDAPTDFLTGAALDPEAGIVRCEDCRALYHPDTAAMLAEHAGGGCASCGGTALRPMRRPRRWREPDAPRRDRALVPEPSTPRAYEAAIGRLVAVSGEVLRELPGRAGAWPAVLLRDASGIELRLVFVGDPGRVRRLRAHALGLLGASVRARGLLVRDEAIGLRLLVLEPDAVRETGRGAPR